MPTVLRVEGYRLYFYSHEPNEPPHIHVDQGGRSVKFWLTPVGVARNLGYTAGELRQIHRLVESNRQLLLGAWNGYFSGRRG